MSYASKNDTLLAVGAALDSRSQNGNVRMTEIVRWTLIFPAPKTASA